MGWRWRCRIATDPDYRAAHRRPVGVVCAEFGYTPGPDLKIEIIEQALTQVTERVFDLLFSSGVGGFFIPDDEQKWVVREMRLAAQKKTGLDISQL